MRYKMTTCFEIAEYFIWMANETGSFMSNLKLQKLVYYSQAWYLAIYGKPLFEEDFEAWIHGPVIKVLYDRYKRWQWMPIQEEVSQPSFNQEVREFLEEVVDEYFSCDAYELERMTHIEEPWIKAREGLAKSEPCNKIITKESMKNYFEPRVETEEKAL